MTNDTYEQYDDGTPILNNVQVHNKLIEPDIKLSEFTTRNLQLGNIDKREFMFIKHKIDRLVKYSRLPKEHGGWVAHDFAKEIGEMIDLIITASTSKNGMGRELLSVQKKMNIHQMQEQKTGSMFFRGNKNE